MWGNGSRDEDNRLADQRDQRDHPTTVWVTPEPKDVVTVKIGNTIIPIDTPRPLHGIVPLRGSDKVVAITRLANNKLIVATQNGHVFKIDPWDGGIEEVVTKK